MHTHAHIEALKWYLDQGVDEALMDEATDKTAQKPPPPPLPVFAPVPERKKTPELSSPLSAPPLPPLLGTSEHRAEALRLAQGATTLEELRAGIAAFDGLPLKKTASHLVFGSGDPQSPIMVVGDVPCADDDRAGAPFMGAGGELLDKILACIDLNRDGVYITNTLNWRPPGDRTPTAAEIEVTLPLIERHIARVQPKILILFGTLTARMLLGKTEGLSKLRGRWHDYTPQTAEFQGDGRAIPAMATYHPLYLLTTPTQKRAVWEDMLAVGQKRVELGLTDSSL